MVKIWCVWRQKSLKLSNLVKTEVKITFHRQSSALRLEMVEPKVYVQCESYAAVLAFAASLPDHTAALRNEISFCFCVKGFSMHLSNLFQLASLSFLVLNSSLDLCMSSTCRPHVLGRNFQTRQGHAAEVRLQSPTFMETATPLRRYARPFLALSLAWHISPAGDQDAMEISGDFCHEKSWDGSGFIRTQLPRGWFQGWVPLVWHVWLVGRTMCGISLRSRNKIWLWRIAGDQFTKCQCFEWPMWPILTNSLHRFQSSGSIAPCSMCLWHTHKCPGRLSSRTKDWVNF